MRLERHKMEQRRKATLELIRLMKPIVKGVTIPQFKLLTTQINEIRRALEKGANPNLKSEDGFTAYDYLRDRNFKSWFSTYLNKQTHFSGGPTSSIKIPSGSLININ